MDLLRRADAAPHAGNGVTDPGRLVYTIAPMVEALALGDPHARRGLPLYLQIEEELTQRIGSGELEPGAQIPTERQLAEQMGVSRMTVRQALGRLEHRGLVERQQGRGTFVARRKLVQNATLLQGFFEQMIGQGVFPTSQLISSAELVATRAWAEALGLHVGEPLYRVVRLRLGDGLPVALETSLFPARIVPGLIALDLAGRSIYRLMAERYGARPVRAIQSLEPVAAEPLEGELLDVAPGSPLMLVERTSWDAAGRRVEYARDLYRGDRSRFVTELRL